MAHLSHASDEWTVEEAAHLINRAGFGGSPREIRRLHRAGRAAAVDRLLAPDEPLDAFPLPAWANADNALASARERFRKLQAMRQGGQGLSKVEAEKRRREAQQAFQREQREQGRLAQGWWFERMLRSEAPLREKMTLFWHDHFATSIQKVKQPVLMLRQNQLFRRHAFGSFRELAAAVVEDPAMMIYLDLQGSRKGMPNENFAREVMELFTLGEGNYSEQDIREAARAFTGYQLNRATGRVSQVPRQWDPGDKTVLGETGPWKGADVIDILFRQQAAARYVPTKLWEFFVGENPPAPLVDRLAAVFREADFRTGPLLREIFLSQDFYSPAVIRTQIKSPVQFLVQMLRQLEIGELPPGYALAAQLQLGQVLLLPPNVAGWDWGKAWINTNTLLTRYNIAGVVTKGSSGEAAAQAPMQKAKGLALPGGLARTMARNWKGPDYERIAPRALRDDPAKLVDSLVFRLFQGPVPTEARANFERYAVTKKGAVFTNREVAELCHLMMSTPYYQLT